jgi:hypothetical protein
MHRISIHLGKGLKGPSIYLRWSLEEHSFEHQ